MLGAVGFSFAAILFILYSVSARSTKLHSLRYNSYANAYLLLALACATWALSVLIGGGALQAGVVVGDAFVITGTVFMLDVITNDLYRVPTILLSSLIGIGVLAARIQRFTPHPYLNGGILVFNSPKTVAVLFVVLFVAIWFPITMHFVSQVLRGSGLLYLGKIGILACVIAVISVCGFLSVKTRTGLITYFIILCCAFSTLILIDYLSKQEQIDG